MIKTKITGGEFLFQIDPKFNGVGDGIRSRQSIVAYAQPDGDLYVCGNWITKREAKAMIRALEKAIAFSECKIKK